LRKFIYFLELFDVRSWYGNIFRYQCFLSGGNTSNWFGLGCLVERYFLKYFIKIESELRKSIRPF
jgi:hypothetical protein